MSNIQKHLWHMGIGNRLNGYKMIILAVALCVEDEDRLQCAQKRIYEPVAKRLSCDHRCVERDIRNAIDRALRTNPDYLSRLAMFKLTQPPTVLQFLDISVTVSLYEKGSTSA